MAASAAVPYTFHYVYQRQVIGVSLAFPIVCTLITALRIFVRLQKRHPVRLDDWFMIDALLCLVGLSVTMAAGGFSGVFGRPTPHPSSDDPRVIYGQLLPGQALIGKLQYAFWIQLTLCYGFAKLSVIFFYRRLFVVGRSIFDHVTKVAIAVSAMWTVAFFFTVVFACGPHPEYIWGPLGELMRCPTNPTYLEAYMISDFLTDCLIYFMPFPLIWNLQMSSGRKLAVSFVLIIGALPLAANAARLAYQILITKYGPAETVDHDLALTLILFSSLIEAGVAIIAINLPVLQPLLGRVKLSNQIESLWAKISGPSAKPPLTRDAVTLRAKSGGKITTGRKISQVFADGHAIGINTTELREPFTDEGNAHDHVTYSVEDIHAVVESASAGRYYSITGDDNDDRR